MNFILADKNDEKTIIHPITLVSINNDSNKYLTLPTNKSNKLSEQNYFTSREGELNTNYESLFYSDEYFFIAIFNANTFDEKIEVVNNILKSDYNKNTVGLVLSRLIKAVNEVNDKKMQDLISIYSKYYKKYDNKDIQYSELYDKIKNML